MAVAKLTTENHTPLPDMPVFRRLVRRRPGGGGGGETAELGELAGAAALAGEAPSASASASSAHGSSARRSGARRIAHVKEYAQPAARLRAADEKAPVLHDLAWSSSTARSQVCSVLLTESALLGREGASIDRLLAAPAGSHSGKPGRGLLCGRRLSPAVAARAGASRRQQALRMSRGAKDIGTAQSERTR